MTNLPGNSSNIKFGGWDQSAIAPGHYLKMFRTFSPQQWDLKADNFLLGGTSFLMASRVISIDPHIPYLYIPNNDWIDFANTMEKHYGKLYCQFSKNKCYFDTACANVPESSVPFEIRIYDI
jgi:hypothetical protein